VLRRYLARALGADPAVAELLLARVRAHHRATFAPRAALFVLVTARPVAAVLPRRARARFVVRFVAPMLDSAPAGLAYMMGRAAHLREPCEGMLEP
jgi:microcystin degradation protein MlrC